METASGMQTWKLRALKKLDLGLLLKEGRLFDWLMLLCESRKTFFFVLTLGGRGMFVMIV